VRWRGDGKELYYIALDGRLMAVPIRFDSAPNSIDAGVPVPLFETRVGGAIQGGLLQEYAASADGQRFLMNTLPETRAPAISVVLNWKSRSRE
jgi:hypothetical protein